MIAKPRVVARVMALSGLGPLFRRVTMWRGLLSLAYHRVGDPSGSPMDHGLWSATAEAFDAQVRFFKKHVDVISLGDLPVVLGRRRGRYGLITFDDGYRDNYEAAFPILKAHGVPATFFLSTGFLDRPRLSWWDEIAWMARTSKCSCVEAGPWLQAPVMFDEPQRERAIRTLLWRYLKVPGEATAAYLDCLAEATGSGRYPVVEAQDTWMTWDMVREMRAAGMCFGGHTVNHPVLAQLPREQQEQEIAGCRARFEAELGEPMTCFSYPIGQPQSFNEDTRACLQTQGVRYAFSYYGGYTPPGAYDPYDLPRAQIESYFTRSMFRSVVTLPQVFT